MSKKFLHPSCSFYSTLWGFLSGIAFSTFFGFVLELGFLDLLIAGLLFFFALLVPTRFTILLTFCGGILIANHRLAPVSRSRSVVEQLTGQTITLKGRLVEEPTHDSGRTIVRLDSIILLADRPESSEPIAGTAYIQLKQTYNDLERSDFVTVEGQLGAGFGTFVTNMYRANLLDYQRSDTGDLFARLKTWFATLIKDYIPSPESDLGLGYLMGMKSSLPDSLSETLQLVGMTHVIVASGAHLGILVNGAKKIFGRISKFAGLFCSILLIFAFVSIVGFTPSMLRASLVSLLSLTFGYIGRKFSPLRLLVLAATITLLLEPVNLINLGWQLSFASFFGLLILSPRLNRLFYGGKTVPWLASMLLTSLSTTLICAPILIYNFGSLSLLAFVANLIILPTLPYAMLLVFLTGATSFIPFLASTIAKLATLLLDLHIAVINYLSTKTMFIVNFPSGNPLVFLLYVVIVMTLISPRIIMWLRNLIKCFMSHFQLNRVRFFR